MLNWVNRFDVCCFLDSHSYTSTYHSVELLAGVGTLQIFQPGDDFFTSLSSFVHAGDDYIFGHFNYDIKNKTQEGLSSSLPDFTGFPDCFLFIPKIVLLIKKDVLQIGVINEDAAAIYDQIINEIEEDKINAPIHINERISKEKYIAAVKELQSHIQLGDCYVINYCQEFFAYANVDPVTLYKQLSRFSPNPFSAFYKLQHNYLLCASPERFIKKEGETIITQPIKGTAPRNHSDEVLDEANKTNLYESRKERSENVMVVDLVRNDLSKVCTAGTVKVDELFGIYSFPNVHQMISTVKGNLCDGTGFGDIIKALFPMGSMTGAPKHKVMELTEQYEHSKRGIYSGTIGYIAPNKDFDYNVVIRSIVYNQASSYLSYHVGGAITSYSIPEDEYEECLLKGRIMASLLAANG